MTKALATMLFSVLLCLGSVVDGNAQQSTTQGLLVGLDFGGATVSFNNMPSDSAGLVGGRIGYGFNRIFTAYVAAYEADVDVREFDGFDKVTFGHVDLGMRLHLANSRRRWVPYGELAITIWDVSDVLKNGETDHHRLQGTADLQPRRRTRHLPVRRVGPRCELQGGRGFVQRHPGRQHPG